MSKIPDDLKYSKQHQWIKIDGDTATIGITDHIKTEFGKIIDVQFLVNEGDSVAKQQVDPYGFAAIPIGAIDLFPPVSGKVTAVNNAISVNSALKDEEIEEIFKNDQYGKGWLIKVKMSDAGEVDSLMDAAAYKAFIEK
ncbi:MAG: glycine cleavage system protein H [Candidatus Lokiarchaeota archaeon]|nr:glycine cleavage system protein H [Candidatus Lokiarchaeota archaeon]